MTQLLQLLASNRKARADKPVIVASANETTIYIYEPIVSSDIEAEFFGGVSAQSLAPQIRNIKAGTINLRISSPGGDVFAAQAICSAIRDTGAKVIAHIDGVAASAATVIANAADEVHISDGGLYMIHKAWTNVTANADEMRTTADLLDKVDNIICSQYAKRSGKSNEEIMALMSQETWFTSQEAVDAGLVNSISPSSKVKASWNLSAYANAPKQEAEQIETGITEEHRARQQQRLSMLARLQVS